MGDHSTVVLQLRLFGAFQASLSDGTALNIRNAKVRAMLALLATAPEGCRTRSYLQEMLWSRSGFEHGRASLRQALTAIRRALGANFDAIMGQTNYDSVHLDLSRVEVIGSARDGAFLEGMDINGADGFDDWLRDQRQASIAGMSVVPAGFSQPPAPALGRLRPAVAVLPFITGNSAGHDGMMGDMLASQVTRQISRNPCIDVISHFSARNVDTHNIKMDDLRLALDVDYVVCGMLRQWDDNYRVDADFIETATGMLKWSHSLDGRKSEFFAGGRGVAEDLADEVMRWVMDASIAQASANPLPDTESHALLMSAVTLMHRQDLASCARSRSYLEETISRAPRDSVLLGWLAMWYVLCIAQGWSVDVDGDARHAKDATQRALDLNPNCSFAVAIDGVVESNLLKHFDRATECFDRAIGFDQSHALAWLLKGTMHAFMGKGDEAVAFTDRARFLTPLDPGAYLFESLSATARLSAEDYQGALKFAEASLERNRYHTSTLRVRAIALHGLGRMDEARAATKQLLVREPKLTVQSYLSNHAAAQFDTGQKWANALQDCGVPKR